MTGDLVKGELVFRRTLSHMLGRIKEVQPSDEPFANFYIEGLLPDDLYAELLAAFPPADSFRAAEDRDGWTALPLTADAVEAMPPAESELWTGVAAALASKQLKRAVFSKLATDITARFNVCAEAVIEAPGFARPVLCRDADTAAVAPHADTRKKVVMMRLHFPADDAQVAAGTALYRRRAFSLSGRFTKVTEFPFMPNSAYAFVVNSTPGKRNWHGREALPSGVGVRASLLNTFYATPQEEFSGYLTRAESRAA